MEMTQEYLVNYEKGLNYQKWVKAQYPKVYRGREIDFYDTKEEQYRIGETKEGVEVKYDEVSASTKRIYIETYEKTDERNANYVASGIYRDDNTKLYLVGDYTIWFLFSKRYLQWLDKLDPPFIYRPEPIPTSIGFCIPFRNAKLLCLDWQKFIAG